MDFSAFDKKVDLTGLQKDIEEADANAGQYDEIPAGKYEVALEKLELKGTKKDGRPMVSAMFRILEGDHKKQCLFMNRVIFGTKNDAQMISSAVGWLKNLGATRDVRFESYTQFKDLIMDIAEEVIGSLEYVVEYDDSEFNSISIKEIFEV